jgi:hypothetical protein
VLSLRFVLLVNYKHDVKWGAPTLGGVSLAPGFTGVVKDFQQCVVIFLGLWKHGLGVGNEQDIAFGRKPLQISQTFFECVPVVSEIIREGECACELIEES